MSLARMSRPCCRSALVSLVGPSQPRFARPRRSLASSPPDVSEQLRQVMRNVPQPVAIAVTKAPTGKYHGATLSSFTSLTLHPYPLVAFSLRLPSRLADSLRPDRPFAALFSDSIAREPGLPPDPLAEAPIPKGKVLGISLLSSPHEGIAAELSKPGQDHSSLFSAPPFTPSERTGRAGRPDSRSSVESVPTLPTAIGNLRCEVVSSLPLKDVYATTPSEEDIEFDDEVEGAGLYKPHPAPPARAPLGDVYPTAPPDEDIEFDDEVDGAGLYKPRSPAPSRQDDPPAQDGAVHGSELFICRVLAVEHGSGAEDPMLYWRHRYTTVNEQ